MSVSPIVLVPLRRKGVFEPSRTDIEKPITAKNTKDPMLVIEESTKGNSVSPVVSRVQRRVSAKPRSMEDEFTA